ncbi:MAG: hypothetical protein WD845_10880 [Pirellulales bacterium]
MAPRPALAAVAARPLAPVALVFLCDFAAKVVWGVAGLLLIRYLPANEYASLTLALAVSSLMIEGVGDNLNRLFIVGYTRLGLAGATLPFLTLQLGLLAALVAVLCGFWNGSTLLVALIAASAFAGHLLAFAKAALQRELKFRAFSLLELARTLLFASALVALIALERANVKAWEVLLLQASCVALVAVVALATTLDHSRLGRPREAWAIGRKIATGGYALMVGYVLAMAVLTRVDVLMLKWLDSSLQLATYGAAYRYHALLALLLAAVHSVLLPLTQRATRADELAAVFAKYRHAVYAVVPFVLLAAWASEWFIPLVDAGKYTGAVTVFRMLCVSTVIGLACSPYVNLLYRYEDFAVLLVLGCAAFALSIGMNLVLIPRFHAAGAAIALCTATGTLNLLIYARARMLLAWHPLPANTSAVAR